MQLQQQEEYGSALAQQIATRISTALETGDLLSVSASLHRFVETSSAEQVAIFDVEGKALGQAGDALGQNLQQYRAPVRVESDIAGQVVITISTDNAGAAHLQFVLSLLGLAVLLSLAVYVATRTSASAWQSPGAMAGSSRWMQAESPARRQRSRSAGQTHCGLPMDLLRTRSETRPQGRKLPHHRGTLPAPDQPGGLH